MSGIAPATCCAGRALLDWSQAQLAVAAYAGSFTVCNFEAGRSIPVTNNLNAIRRTLKAAEVEFVSEKGAAAGMRLRRAER